MKQLNINLFAVIFSMIWIFNSFGEEKAFYYYQNEKIHIEPQRDKIIIYAGKTKTPIDEILRKKDIRLDQLCITREISENDSVFIISSSAQLIESMIDIINSDNEFEYISPVYLTDEGKELGLKNESVVSQRFKRKCV